MNIRWYGEFDNTDRRSPKFKAGYTYQATIKLAFSKDGDYVGNHIIKDGDYYLDDALFKATVNGKTAKTRVSAPYYPTIQVNLPISGESGSNVADTGKSEYNDRHTFSHVAGLTSDAPVGKSSHVHFANLATDEAYVGVTLASTSSGRAASGAGTLTITIRNI